MRDAVLCLASWSARGEAGARAPSVAFCLYVKDASDAAGWFGPDVMECFDGHHWANWRRESRTL